MIALSPLVVIYLTLFISGFFLDLVLVWINMRHLRRFGHVVPLAFSEYVDPNRLVTISDYTMDNQRFEVLTSCVSSVAFLVLVLSGVLPWVVNGLAGINLGNIVSGLVFFALLGATHTIFSLPFSYYRTFVIENQHGFNTTTLKIWMADLVKSILVGSVLGGIMLVAVLALIEFGGSLWWLWAWAVFFSFQLLLLGIYPTVIAPMFNTFVPLEDSNLEKKVRALMAGGGLSVDGVFSMDAGKRSRHTNAYFTGFGKTKRIVLFDTLLEAHDDEEILAILAHEIGHWKKRHILKTLVLVGCLSLLLFYVAFLCIQWFVLYDAFGFDHRAPYVGLFLFGILWDSVSQFFSPMTKIISRRHEREADAFAVRLLGKSNGLVQALKKLGNENLSNLYPHPMYAWFHYSHPPLLERIRYLEQIKEKT